MSQDSKPIAPAKRIDAPSDTTAAAANAAAAIRKHCPAIPRPLLQDLQNGIAEALDNALDHAGTGRAILKLFSNGSRITATISDRGCGIPAAMRRNRSIAGEERDHILLQTATNPGTTSTGEPGRGRGLHFLLSTARQPGHTLEIRSARTKLKIHADGKITATEEIHRSGTLITIGVPLTPKTTEQ